VSDPTADDLRHRFGAVRRADAFADLYVARHFAAMARRADNFWDRRVCLGHARCAIARAGIRDAEARAAGFHLPGRSA
jgi:hypothetical protein